jgi:hypothetical protein
MQPLAKDEVRNKVAAPAPGAAHTARRVLLKAADLIEQRGWAQGRFEDADGRLCIHGAIHVAVSGLAVRNDRDRDSLSTAAWHQFREYLLVEGVERELVRLGFMFWNDSPKRTQKEVVQALREAAIWGQPRAQIIEFRPRVRA